MSFRVHLPRFAAGRSAASLPVREASAPDASGRTPLLHGLLRSLFCAALTVQVFTGCARSVPAEPVQWDLTPEAQLTYATLLLDQSIRNDDREGVLEASSILLSIESRPQPFIDAAAWLILNKENGEARNLLEKAILRVPGDLSLHLLLAETWINQGDNERAVHILQDYERAHPHSRMAKQELGILYVKTGRFLEADRILSALPGDMRTPFVRYAHAQALHGLNRPRPAIRELRLAVEESPEFLDAWFELARLLEQEKAYSEASEIYASLLEQDPENEDVWIRLVEGEMQSGRGERALEYARRGPDTFGFRLTAATLFLDSKLFREAETLLQELKDRPGVPDEVNFYLAAIAFEYHKNVQETLDLLAAIPEGNRFYDRALRLRIQLLHDTDRRPEALPLIRHGQELFPEDRDFRLMEVHLYLTDDLYSEALTATDTALTLWPSDENFLYMRGSILDSLGRKNEAFRLMEQLAVSHPDFAPALNYVGYSLAERGKELDRALDLLQRAVKLSPNHGYVLDSLAWAQFRKGMTAEAWATISRAVVLPDGNDAAIWDHYGDIAAAQGRREEARKGWERALNLKQPQPDGMRKKLEAV